MERFLDSGSQFVSSNLGRAWLIKGKKELEKEKKKREIVNGPKDNLASGSGVYTNKRKNPFILDEAEVSGEEGSADEDEEGEGDVEGFIDDESVFDDSPPLNPYIGVVTQIGKTLLKTHKWCDVCGVEVDYSNWSRHRKTKKHIKNNATSEGKTPRKAKPPTCEAKITVTSDSEHDGVSSHVASPAKKRKRIITEADKGELYWDHTVMKYKRKPLPDAVDQADHGIFNYKAARVILDEPPSSPVKERLADGMKLPKISLKRKRGTKNTKSNNTKRRKTDTPTPTPALHTTTTKTAKKKTEKGKPEKKKTEKKKTEKGKTEKKKTEKKKRATPIVTPIVKPIGEVEIEMDLDVLLDEFRKGRRAGLGFADDKKTRLMSKSDRLCVRRLQDGQIDREVAEIRKMEAVCPLPKIVHSLIRGELRLPRMRVLLKEMEGKKEGHNLCGDCWVWVEKKRLRQHKGSKKHMIAAGDMSAKECESYNWLITLKEVTDKYILGGKLSRNVKEEACPLQSFVVAREFGTDGRSTHLHVYLSYHTKVVREEVQNMIYNVKWASIMFDVPADIALPKMPAKHFVQNQTTIHCEIVRSVNATLKYITKEDYSPCFMNIDSDLFHWNFKIMCIILQSEDLDPFSYHFLSLPMQYKEVLAMRHSQYWNSIMAVEDQDIATKHISSLRLKFINVISKLKEKGVFLYGPPGTGKTVIATAYSGDCYSFNADTKFPFTSHTRERDLVFDDVRPDDVLRHRQALLQLTGGYRCPVEVKGGRIHSIRLKGKLFISSNYDIYNHIQLGKGEWRRRFAYIQVLHDSIRLLKGTRMVHGLEQVSDIPPMPCDTYQTGRFNPQHEESQQERGPPVDYPQNTIV